MFNEFRYILYNYLHLIQFKKNYLNFNYYNKYLYLNLATKMDYFGIPFQLNYKGRERFRSRFGFLMTILVIAIIVIAFVYFGADLYNR